MSYSIERCKTHFILGPIIRMKEYETSYQCTYHSESSYVGPIIMNPIGYRSIDIHVRIPDNDAYNRYPIIQDMIEALNSTCDRY